MYSKSIPKISIVTPSFNQGQFLEETIDSVLSQNYSNLEYIIIDGGSTDESVEIIKRYEKHLSFWCSEPDGGHYQAVNKGFSKSTGEIMAWLNSDDKYFPGALETVADVMVELKEVEWLTTLSPAAFDWHGFCLGYSAIPGYCYEAFLNGYYSAEQSYRVGWIQQESTFWRRNLWERAGGKIRTEFEFAGDFDLWGQFFLHAELYGIHTPLGGFRYRFDQRVRQNNYGEEVNQSLNELRKDACWNPNPLMRAIRPLNLHHIPKIGRVCKTRYGFLGKRIVRSHPETPESCWLVETYKFL